MATKIRELEEPYAAVPVRQLIVGTRLPCDIFIKENGPLRIFLGKDVLYMNISQDLLKENNISDVYIHVRDIPDFDFYLSRNRLLRQTGDAAGIEAFKKYSSVKEQFHQIDATLITPGTKINFGLYAVDRFKFSPLIEATDEAPAAADDSITVEAADVFIKKNDLPRYHGYISSLQQSAEITNSDRPEIKTLILKEMTKIVLREFFDDPGSDEKIIEINTMVHKIMELIAENRDSIHPLLSLKGYDYYSYTHSLNVAILSMSLGLVLDLKQDDMEKLGMGVLLHDVGKIAIPHEILNKQGNLSDAEFNIFKNHVLEGEKIMRKHKNFPQESFSAILQHHEKLSGRGYPYGLSGGKVSLFGRISAISDYYDVLTTPRLYKVAYKPFQALLKMSGEKEDYDTDLLKRFIKMLGNMT
ncbi:MAG TPA: HD domain-containing phosphohydrolase [Dissulfurispiraceae bacterium]|nr:HD domain-containing phosphohydrolase [Dissulfurispiraceae bacterium]